MNGEAVVVRVEHPVWDFEAWKRDGLDEDSLGREQSGVRPGRVLRSSSFGMLMAVAELEFDGRSQAEIDKHTGVGEHR